MIFLRLYIELFIILFFFFSSFFENVNLEKPLACVGNKYLYESSLPPLLKNTLKNENKRQKIFHHINTWIEKNLLLSELEKKKVHNTSEIQKKILDYKYFLLLQNFIEKNISGFGQKIFDEEIKNYYQANLSNFELKENIVRGRFIIVSKKIPESNNLSKFFFSKNPLKIKELQKYCERYAISYMLSSDVWYKFSDMINNTPLVRNKNILGLLNLLKKKKVYKVIGKNNIYYFNIHDFKISNEISPLEYQKDKIKNIIIHQKKFEKRAKILKDLLNEAKKNINYEIYYK